MLPDWILPSVMPAMLIKSKRKHWLERDPRSIACDFINARRREQNKANGSVPKRKTRS